MATPIVMETLEEILARGRGACKSLASLAAAQKSLAGSHDGSLEGKRFHVCLILRVSRRGEVQTFRVRPPLAMEVGGSKARWRIPLWAFIPNKHGSPFQGGTAKASFTPFRRCAAQKLAEHELVCSAPAHQPSQPCQPGRVWGVSNSHMEATRKPEYQTCSDKAQTDGAG